MLEFYTNYDASREIALLAIRASSRFAGKVVGAKRSPTSVVLRSVTFVIDHGGGVVTVARALTTMLELNQHCLFN